MYAIGVPAETQHKRRKWPWLVLLILILLLAGGLWWLKGHLKPHTTITQAKTVTVKVSTDTGAKKHYVQDGFGIDLPASWAPQPRPTGPYKIYRWQSTIKGKLSDQVIDIYQDTIPSNFGVNRVQIIEAADDQLTLKGPVSDNCNTYTKNAPSNPSHEGAQAKWQGVDFLCDQANLQRDVIGTSSTDGVNVILLKSPSTGSAHKFFFNYTDYDVSPDYTDYTNMLLSFRIL